MSSKTQTLDALAPVPESSLRRAEAEEAAKQGGNGSHNLLRHIEHAAPDELKALRTERDALVAKVLDLNERIARVETHALVSPKSA